MTVNILRHSERSEESVWGEYFRWFKTQPAGSTLRLRLCRSVGNLLLTSSLALLDSTLPKIRQNDGNCWVKTQPTIVKSAKEIKSSLLNSLTTKTLK